jgi:hypothetical protein
LAAEGNDTTIAGTEKPELENDQPNTLKPSRRGWVSLNRPWVGQFEPTGDKEEASKKGMEEKSREFTEKGSELYAKR